MRLNKLLIKIKHFISFPERESHLGQVIFKEAFCAKRTERVLREGFGFGFGL
jgi:hypothetical protein